MLAHFAEVMKPALERYFLGRFRLGRGSVHAVSEHAELQRDDLIPIRGPLQSLAASIAAVLASRPLARANSRACCSELMFRDRSCGDLVLKQCPHPNPEVPEQMVIRQTLPK